MGGWVVLAAMEIEMGEIFGLGGKEGLGGAGWVFLGGGGVEMGDGRDDEPGGLETGLDVLGVGWQVQTCVRGEGVASRQSANLIAKERTTEGKLIDTTWVTVTSSCGKSLSRFCHLPHSRYPNRFTDT